MTRRCFCADAGDAATASVTRIVVMLRVRIMSAPVMYRCGAVGEVRLFTGNSGNFVADILQLCQSPLVPSRFDFDGLKYLTRLRTRPSQRDRESCKRHNSWVTPFATSVGKKLLSLR